MAYQASAVFTPVMPSFKGFSAAMNKGVGPAAAKAGQAAGAAFGKGFASRASTGAQGVAAVEKRIADSVSAASRAVKAARTAEAEATRKAGIEEAKLHEIMASGKAKQSQILAAEDRLIRAHKALGTAAGRTQIAQQDLDDAIAKGVTELKAANGAADKAGRSFQTLGGRIKSAVGGAGRGAFTALPGLAKQAGLNAGRNLNRGLAVGMGSLGAVVKTAAGGIAGAVAGGALALGALGAAGVAVGVKTAAGMETAKIGFETMLGSAKKADAFLRDLQKFAATTPFEFPELQTAASSLISSGVAAKDVIPIMRTLGDATAGMGTGSEGIQRATVALQQMNAAGKISAEDLNQLRDAGIPVYDLLAKATGKSKAEVVKLAASGKLGKKELDQLMASLRSGKGLERFNGLMAKTSTSLTGLASTFKDTFNQGAAQAIQPLIPLIKQGLTQGIEGLGRVMPKIADLFKATTPLIESFGRIGKGAITPFVHSLTGGKDAFQALADYISTHQAQITRVFVVIGEATIQFGKALAVVVVGALRGVGHLYDVWGGLTRFIISSAGVILDAAAKAFRWVPDLGPKLKAANEEFKSFSGAAIAATKGPADAARRLADGIEGKMIPALEAARQGFDKLGKTEAIRAKVRDAVAKAAIAIRDLGTNANGSQVKLKKFSDITKLGSGTASALRGRLADVRQALRDQVTAMQKAGAGQKSLTKAWEIGKDRLYKEFRQMGLSKAEAGRLAKQYAGIKPKVQTKFTQPGMTEAQKRTRDLKNRLEAIKNRKVSLTFTTNAGTVKAKLAIGSGQGRILKPGQTGGGNTSATGGYIQVGKPVSRRPLRRAGGGPVKGVGGPREDNIAGFDRRTGVQTAWVSNKEFVVNAKAYEKNRALVEAINSGQQVGTGFAHGGPIRLADGGSLQRQFQLRVGALPKSARQLPDAFDKFSKYNVQQAGKAYASAGKAMLQKLLNAKLAASTGGPGGDGGLGNQGSGMKAAARAGRKLGASYIAFHRDPSGYPSYDMGSSGRTNSRIAAHLLANHAKYSIRYIISQMRIVSGRNGWHWRPYHPITNQGDFRHVAHVHSSYFRDGGAVKNPVRKYDSGGSLPPGLSLAMNGTGKPETILTDKQLMGLRGQRGGTVFNFGDAYGMSPREIAREFFTLVEQREALKPAW